MSLEKVKFLIASMHLADITAVFYSKFVIGIFFKDFLYARINFSSKLFIFSRMSMLKKSIERVRENRNFKHIYHTAIIKC